MPPMHYFCSYNRISVQTSRKPQWKYIVFVWDYHGAMGSASIASKTYKFIYREAAEARYAKLRFLNKEYVALAGLNWRSHYPHSEYRSADYEVLASTYPMKRLI